MTNLKTLQSRPTNRQIQLMNAARSSATFESELLTCLIYGGPATVHARRVAWDRVEILLGTKNTRNLPRCYRSQNREEQYLDGLATGKATFEDCIDHKHSLFINVTPRYQLANASPFGLHFTLFEPTLRLLATDTQLAKWAPPTEAGRINGTYIQTELGHGTFVRGLQTTATFDPETDEFILHTPTIKATKFWPGGMAFSCTHAIVMAQLITKGQTRGPHAFLLQLRSLEDYRLRPGITVSDLGLKMSYNGTDNGTATFNHVRIPRSQMLMRHAAVLRDGTYVPSSKAKTQYSGMTSGRSVIVSVSGLQLAQAITISTRYSVVREQGLGPNATLDHEVPIFTYKTQHYRLLTLTARAYAILFAAKYCDAEYRAHLARVAKEDFSMAQAVHVLSSGLKAWASNGAAEGAEEARRCAGGKGYVNLSGLPDIVTSVSALVTLEGETYSMWQQVFKYLLKTLDALEAGKTVRPDLVYLAETHEAERCEAQGQEFLSPEVQLGILRHRARKLVRGTAEMLRKAEKDEMSKADAWNKYMLDAVAAAQAYIEALTLSVMISATSTDTLSALSTDGKDYTALAPVLQRLRSLFALSTITSFTDRGDNYISTAQHRAISNCVDDLLEQLYPDAIALTDTWDFTDASLASAIGCRDGDAYVRMMEWVGQVPMNRAAEENGGLAERVWKEFVEPVVRGHGRRVVGKPKL